MSVKGFEEGMEAAAKPYEAKYQQYAEAFDRVKKEFDQNWKEATNVTDEILDDLKRRQNKILFRNNTQVDIKDLADYEKEILVATLYTLSKDYSNEDQKGYIRAVQKYLEIKNPQQVPILPWQFRNWTQNLQKLFFKCVWNICFLQTKRRNFLLNMKNAFSPFSM
jgi:hypothetical protein